MKMHKVFVYGSLLSGMGNYGLIAESKKLGDTKTPNGFGLIDLGYFPGALQVDEGNIIGEVYEIDDHTLNRLDRLEGYKPLNPENGMYNRIEIDTEFGKAFIYIYNNGFGRPVDGFVENGDWRTYYNNKRKR
jgi:gamma-glutamylcyclotransferase (GGCT)/AIG2-like uncharacterized protein YtfP